MKKLGIGVLTMVAVAGLLVVGGPSSVAQDPPTTAFPPCQVQLSATPTQGMATVVSGCTEPGAFLFQSTSGIKTAAVLFDSVTSPPWVVKLPPCGPWQLDFVTNVTPPGRHLYRYLTGEGATCQAPTTTTTVPDTTTTTSIPTSQTMGACFTCSPPSITTPTTTTTLPQITAEQQQIQVAPGVTRGNG